MKKYTKKELDELYVVFEHHLLYPINDGVEEILTKAKELSEEYQINEDFMFQLEILFSEIEGIADRQGFEKGFLAHQIINHVNFLDADMLSRDNKEAALVARQADKV